MICDEDKALVCRTRLMAWRLLRSLSKLFLEADKSLCGHEAS